MKEKEHMCWLCLWDNHRKHFLSFSHLMLAMASTQFPLFPPCVISDAPSTEQQELFTQKLQQCCMLFDFLDSVTDLKNKEIKRATLNELVDYVSTNRGVLVESAYPEITTMVSRRWLSGSPYQDVVI